MKIFNEKINVEADVEKLIEKGMDNHEKNWKEKFITKHNAKKELSNQKHLQKIEIEELKQKRKSFFEKKAEEKQRKQKLKLQALREKKKEERKELIFGSLMMIGIIIVILIICIIMEGLGA